MIDIEKIARQSIAAHDLHPLEHPMGDDHHTDAKFEKEDVEVAELAFWLGGLFIDKQGYDPSTPYEHTYWYNEMTSVNIWKRVARALRIHGLKIVDR